MTEPSPAKSPAAKQLAPPFSVQYLGFRNALDRREYVLRARSGPDAREYTVSIAHSAFAARDARLQDGPDICYQRLQRELAEVGAAGVLDIAVTESDLATYRAAHAPPARRTWSPPRPNPPPATAWMDSAPPTPPDGRG